MIYDLPLIFAAGKHDRRRFFLFRIRWGHYGLFYGASFSVRVISFATHMCSTGYYELLSIFYGRYPIIWSRFFFVFFLANCVLYDTDFFVIFFKFIEFYCAFCCYVWFLYLIMRFLLY